MNRSTFKKIAEYIFREKESNELSELELKRIERCVLNNYKSFKEDIHKQISKNGNKKLTL